MKRRIAMADEMEQALEKDQEAITAGAQKDELSHEDSEKVVGGRDASAPSISEIVITKVTDAATP
jgi:type VI protein secretion system component Hcp